ncbi:MAG: GSCFA domain-containing protein, partial [Bacteroidales bacterium]|nr:GSCFA domain-containing protein [Bacteroidales bacterium]
MIKLQTPVIDQKCNVGISYSDKILLLGSCFTDNIGQSLKGYGFDVCVNPFGTLYNPASIVNAMQRLITGTPFMEKECVQMGSGSNLICSFSHHTSFSRKTGKEFLENANSELEKASRFLMECDKIIITLGTAWFFRHTGYIQKDGTIKPDNGRIVANCLKRDAKEFSREMLDRQTAGSMLDAIAGICECRKKKIIFTVSPIRHMADVANVNMVSNSTLMLAVDDAIRKINSS